MKINFKSVLLILLLILAAYPRIHVFCQSLSSSELIGNAKEHDGKPVTFTGEAIGDIMLRGEFAWVNINDGDNALGIWMSAALAKEINFTGSYKTRGDKVEVTGIFHRACSEHGGDLDIHAQSLRKLGDGRIVNQKLNLDKRNLSISLFGALILIWILSLFRHR